jgi:hypothetical protein
LDSNEIDERELQYEKHDDPRMSTFRGISIDSSNKDENIFESIRVSREFDSNEIDEIDSQPEKHDDPRILIVFIISTSDDLEKFRINR